MSWQIYKTWRLLLSGLGNHKSFLNGQFDIQQISYGSKDKSFHQFVKALQTRDLV